MARYALSVYEVTAMTEDELDLHTDVDIVRQRVDIVNKRATTATIIVFRICSDD